jgi:putative aminopeptidase FrvX
VGHGAATGIPVDVKEVLAVDMAAVGPGQNSDEYSVGICVKDSGGPYSLEMKRLLMHCARAQRFPTNWTFTPTTDQTWDRCGDRARMSSPG